MTLSSICGKNTLNTKSSRNTEKSTVLASPLEKRMIINQWVKIMIILHYYLVNLTLIRLTHLDETIFLTLLRNTIVGSNNTDTLNGSGLTTSLCPTVMFVFANLSTTRPDNTIRSPLFFPNISGRDFCNTFVMSSSYCLSRTIVVVWSESENLKSCCRNTTNKVKIMNINKSVILLKNSHV